ncbi:MAG TPA: 2-succinyl-6-hydroxy-2,4-cyclohexadiene-1-carboxylate synthase [Longimicrobiales bacterium]
MSVELRDGLVLRVVEAGGGDATETTALLLHGFTGSVEAWREAPLLALARRRRVLAVDLLGHGRSSVGATPARFALEEMVRDLVEVLDHAGVGRAVWVGYSMGGRVALGGAVLAPERVAALVLESASPGLEDEGERRGRRAGDEALAATIEAGGVEDFVARWTALPLFASQARLPAGIREGERLRRLEASPEGLARCLRGLGLGCQPSFWEALGSVDVPALILTGELDEKFTRIGERMAGLMPQATRVVVPGAGHAVHLEDPESWAREVVRFLR